MERCVSAKGFKSRNTKFKCPEGFHDSSALAILDVMFVEFLKLKSKCPQAAASTVGEEQMLMWDYCPLLDAIS